MCVHTAIKLTFLDFVSFLQTIIMLCRFLPTLVGSGRLQPPLSNFYHHSGLFYHHSQGVQSAEMPHHSDYPGENPGYVKLCTTFEANTYHVTLYYILFYLAVHYNTYKLHHNLYKVRSIISYTCRYKLYLQIHKIY